MEKLALSLIERFGYELHHKGIATLVIDPFEVTKELISSVNPMIFDIRANVGSTVKQYRTLFPNASIHCFEPFPQSFEALEVSMESDPSASLHRIALSDTKGKATFHANASPETNSLLLTDQSSSLYWEAASLQTANIIEVETTTVDAFCRENNVPFVDMMKLDVQGAEFSVLTGAKEMLSTQSVSLIYTELILVPTYEGQKKLHEYIGLLDSFGYDLLDTYNPFRKHQQLIQTDCIFLSDKFKQSSKKASS